MVTSNVGQTRTVTFTEELLERARSRTPAERGLPARPSGKVAIVACMDARLDPYNIFGLAAGEAHLLRNAGGAVTDDTIRSLCLSQRLLGTEEVILVHHTDCGLLGLDEEGFRREVEDAAGERPPWSLEAFASVDDDVRRSIERVRESPFLASRGRVRGFVYDVATGELREVD